MRRGLVIAFALFGSLLPGRYLVTVDGQGSIVSSQEGHLEIAHDWHEARLQRVQPPMRIDYPVRIETPARM